MKAALERWLLRRWYGGERPGLVLRALAGVYRVAAASRKLEPVRVGVPVIVVGNFTAGGTGKTPLVAALAAHLVQAGWRPGIVSRGHGRASRAPLRVAADTPIADSGDEPRLLFELTGLPVFVDADRVAAARAAVAAGCDLILADDGLQHRRLARDLEIEVVDGQRRYGNGLLIPAGPLREAPRACDFRVVNGGEAGEGEWPMRLQLGDAFALDEPAHTRSLASFAGVPVQAIAGIGHPDRFFEALAAAGLQVRGHAFPDHHAYAASELAPLPRPLLMTAKDAMKCRGLGLADAWVVPAQARLSPGFLERVLQALPSPRPRP